VLLFFVIGGSLLPIGAVYLLVRVRGTTPSPELLFGEGQALLLAAAISADATGRIVSGVWSKRTPLGIFQLLLFLICLSVIVVTAVEFQSILASKTSNQLDVSFIIYESKVFAFGSLLAGFGAILVVDE